jgi:hypothetical protein
MSCTPSGKRHTTHAAQLTKETPRLAAHARKKEN